MCNPNQAIGLQLGSTGLQAGSQLIQSRFESAALRQNAILAERQAVRALEAGAAAGSQVIQEGREVAGQQEAILAAGNIDPNSSRSALALLTDTSATAAEDAAIVRDNAQQTADALKLDASESRSARRNLKIATPLAVGSGLLTGGSRAYGIYRKLGE